MSGLESASFDDESLDAERLRRIARAADAGLGPAILVLARIYGMTTEQLVELQQTFREVLEENPEADVQ